MSTVRVEVVGHAQALRERIAKARRLLDTAEAAADAMAEPEAPPERIAHAAALAEDIILEAGADLCEGFHAEAISLCRTYATETPSTLPKGDKFMASTIEQAREVADAAKARAAVTAVTGGA